MVEHDYHGVVGMEQFSYSILEKIPSDSLFVIDGNHVSLALRREDATHRGIASNVYNQLLQMIDTVNNRAVLLANYQNPSCGYNHSFVPTLLNTGILTYSTTDLSYYKMSPSVGVDQFAGFCPNCALIQGFLVTLTGLMSWPYSVLLPPFMVVLNVLEAGIIVTSSLIFHGLYLLGIVIPYLEVRSECVFGKYLDIRDML